MQIFSVPGKYSKKFPVTFCLNVDDTPGNDGAHIENNCYVQHGVKYH